MYTDLLSSSMGTGGVLASGSMGKRASGVRLLSSKGAKGPLRMSSSIFVGNMFRMKEPLCTMKKGAVPERGCYILSNSTGSQPSDLAQGLTFFSHSAPRTIKKAAGMPLNDGLNNGCSRLRARLKFRPGQNLTVLAASSRQTGTLETTLWTIK